MIFEDKSRVDTTPRTLLESGFEYLDRAARPEADNVRDFLNQWVSSFPIDDANELISRIKSRDQRSFDSATFEIILFAILHRLNFSVEIHPTLENESEKHPDFLVTTTSGEQFYLEAVLASEFSEAERAAEKRKNVILEIIDKIPSPNFMLGITANGNPDTPPPGKLLRKRLSDWLASLDAETIRKQTEQEGSEKLPTWKWSHESWEIEFQAFPRSANTTRTPRNSIGAIFGDVEWSNIWEPIRDSIKSKGNKYGRLSKPLIVAVNVDRFDLDKIDEMQALFGQEEIIVPIGVRDQKAIMRRMPNGLWVGRKGPQYKRVSGAWLFGNISPWNIPSRRNTLYLNPWADFPVNPRIIPVNLAFIKENVVQRVGGMALHETLGIAETWPG